MRVLYQVHDRGLWRRYMLTGLRHIKEQSMIYSPLDFSLPKVPTVASYNCRTIGTYRRVPTKYSMKTKYSTLSGFPYSSIERSLESSSMEISFQRSTLSYILPMKPLSSKDDSTKVIPKLAGGTHSTSNTGCLAFFEVGGKKLRGSTLSHW